MVVIDRVAGDLASAAQGLAAALGSTAYECRPRVSVPEGGPAVVSVHADPVDAQGVRTRIEEAGFQVWVIEADSGGFVVPGLQAREFSLGPTAIRVEDRAGQHAEIPFAAIDVVVRGVAQIETRATETVKQRKLSVGRAVLTGGLVTRRTVQTQRSSTSTAFEGFVYVYSTGADSPVCLQETELSYRGLAAAMQPSRTANFTYLTTEIRRLATGATWDERLVRRAVQQQILGPTLGPEDHIGLAVTLIASSHRARRG